MILTSLLVAVAAACTQPAPVDDQEAPDVPPPQLLTRRIPAQDTLRERLNSQITQSRRSAITDAARVASPAVVSVNVIRRTRTTRRSMFDFGFFPREYEQIVQGLGSGFIISPDGITITNQHVTDGAEQIVVTTSDGTDYAATLLGEDPLTDIAVLQVDGKDLPTLPIGSSQNLEIGEWVVAIGSPYAYLLGDAQPTVTAGVVSATGRNLLPSQDQPGIYVGMIQTDAAINPGNSGGPLVNVLGEAVGVNSSIFTRSGGSVGIGFAIPIERATRVASELLRFGAVRRAWAGIGVTTETNLRDWKRMGGLSVLQVAPGSPADRAGIRPEDVLVSVMGQPMRTFLDWEAIKLDISPGDSVNVTFRHGDNQPKPAVLAFEPLPSSQAERVSVLDIEMIGVTPQIQQERRLAYDYGALVTAIPQRTGEITGLQVNDVILQVNRTRITSPGDFQDVLRRAQRRTAIQVFFERDGRIHTTSFFVE